MPAGALPALIRFTARGYALPLLSLIAKRGGARLPELCAATGASRATLNETLGALIEAGLIVRNQGAGHPLRPDYLVASTAEVLGSLADAILRAAEPLGDSAPLIRAKWTLPIVHAAGRERIGFNALKDALRPATPRAISLALKDLEGRALADRRLAPARPPAVVYRLRAPLTRLVGPTTDFAAGLAEVASHRG